MRIIFVHEHTAFLPGIPVYTEFFSRYGIHCATASRHAIQGMKGDVEWYFMGMDLRRRVPGTVRIHEYASSSLGPMSGLKDGLKKLFNRTPDYRIFQNTFVAEQYRFRDQVPYGFREPCLSPLWLEATTAPEKKYDFIYIGAVNRQRNIDQLLRHFCGPMKRHRLLILAKDYERLQKKYRHADNIVFEGPLHPSAVKQSILASRYAINFIPDRKPFSHQVSTKLLEYAACKIPIVTTSYAWMRNFERTNGGTYFYLADDLSNFNWQAVQSIAYTFPDLTPFAAANQIRQSGILDFLQAKFPGLLFTPD